MLCSHPFRPKGKVGVEFGCGQCLPCRFNKRRVWTARLMLEARQHESSFFCTLTYDKKHLPDDSSVSVRDAQLFLKRVRKAVEPDRIRFFLVGEYGDHTWRPHYHAALFGLREGLAVNAAWDKGFVQCVPLTQDLAQYLCGYTVKKLTREDDERTKAVLAGRRPEFARMSLRPGIGGLASRDLVNSLIDPETGEIRMAVDVPSAIRSDGRLWPIGRYIRRRMRSHLGMDVAESRPAAEARMQAERERWPVVDWNKNRDPKEQKRLQDSRKAAVLNSIGRSKRGL